MKDAQQEIIEELRYEISILRDQIESRDRHMNVCRGRTKCPADEVLAEWLKGFIRIDDPVVTGLVEQFKNMMDELPQFGPSSMDEVYQKAISAYEARVKEVEK